LSIRINTYFSISYKTKKDASQHLIIYHFFFGTGGFNEGVLPGVSLLSRCLRSGLPVESAILFGPGLSAIIINFNLLNIKDIIN
jgi:hypothetical protein